MNGTYSDRQRQAMQQEVTTLQAEWNRIVEGTTFNGQQILTGTGTKMLLQGGESMLGVQVGKEALAGGFGDSAGATTRVSTDSAGGEGNQNSEVCAISADGRYVAFNSNATNLVSGDTNNAADVFVKDTVTGVTTRVSTDSSGGQATGGVSSVTGSIAISADGRYVAFSSNATNLVSGDTNAQTDAFIKDTLTGVTTRVSTDSSGGQATGGASYVRAISADGRYVAFGSDATNLVSGDTNNAADVFVKDTVTGVTTRVSTDSSGGQATGGASYVSAISADGRYVAFGSDATNLVSGDTNGARDAFIKDTVTGVTTRVSTDSFGGQATGGASYVSAISADGRYVAFWSNATNLVSGDTNAQADAFIKDTLTGVTTRVSTDSSGGQASGGHSYANAISADGRYVVFQSAAANLVSGDTNGLEDAFIKDTLTGVTTRVSIDSSGGQATDGASYDAVISADGRYVAFVSDQSTFVLGDGNDTSDIFLRDLTKMGVQTLAGMVVNNKASAAVTLNLVQKYKDELMEYRSNIGATTSRIGYFIGTLETTRINYTQAFSRITDTDVAEDSSRLIASQTRQQVAASLLAQANQAPQVALSLLRNV